MFDGLRRSGVKFDRVGVCFRGLILEIHLEGDVGTSRKFGDEIYRSSRPHRSLLGRNLRKYSKVSKKKKVL